MQHGLLVRVQSEGVGACDCDGDGDGDGDGDKPDPERRSGTENGLNPLAGATTFGGYDRCDAAVGDR